MKAIVVREPGRLVLETVADPQPRPGQCVLRVRACGICGTDLQLHRADALRPGTVMGHEFCGEITESLGGLRSGTRVCVIPTLACGACERCRSGLGAYCASQTTLGLGEEPGAFAEYAAIAPHQAVRLSDGVDDALGALVEPLAVGLHAVNVGRIRRGDRCFVIGAGPIGLAISIWARHFGARSVIVSERLATRRAIAEEIGATAVIDPCHDELRQAMARLAPEGPDVVFEAVGAPGLIQQAIDAVRFRGRVVVVGSCFAPDSIRPTPAMNKEASVHFVLACEKDDLQYAVDMLDQERITPGRIITDRIGLAEVPAAFDALRGPDRPCKVIALTGDGDGRAGP